MDFMPSKTLTSTDAAYPQLLTEAGIKSSLNLVGNYDFNQNDTYVGVIGTRKPSVYGQVVTQKVVSELVYGGCVVVSGFMYGIDMEAHNASVENGGKTLCVLGYGLEHLYKTFPKYVIDRYSFSGGFITEYEYKESPKKWTFAKRNKIIAGLCSLLVVIEAEQKSGSFITCHWAKKFKRDIYAIPGSILSEKSYGTNMLIKQGVAELLLSVNDLSKRTGLKKDDPSVYDETNIEDQILTLLKASPQTFDQICTYFGTLDSANAVLIMSNLELQSKVKKMGNLYYVC